MAAEKSTQVMVRLTPEMLTAVKDHAQDTERTVAQVVRLAIKRYLEK